MNTEVISKKSGKTGLYILLSLLLAGVLASGALSLVACRSSIVTQNLIRWASEEGSGETQENDVTIAGEYVIEDTSQISDAYKNGDSSSLSDKQQETLDMAKAVLDEVITDGMSDYEKEKAVYDWMCANLNSDDGLLTVIPTTQADCDNPYGVLKYHNAVCVGYATTFRLFMEMLDIPCMVVHNTEAYHAWDLVQLDGEWYHTDVYSDVGTASYANFNLSDEMMSSSESWDTDFFPAATGLTYNMAYQQATDCTDISEIPQLIRDSIDQSSALIALKFSSDFDETQAQAVSSMVSAIETLLWNTESYQNVYLSVSFSAIDSGYLLSINVENYDLSDSGNSFLDAETAQQVTDAVNQAFGDLGTVDESDLSGSWDSNETADTTAAELEGDVIYEDEESASAAAVG